VMVVVALCRWLLLLSGGGGGGPKAKGCVGLFPHQAQVIAWSLATSHMQFLFGHQVQPQEHGAHTHTVRRFTRKFAWGKQAAPFLTDFGFTTQTKQDTRLLALES
jgi:hypothetical protein